MKRFSMVMAVLVLVSAGLFATGGRQQSGSTVTTLPPGGKSLDRFTINYFDFHLVPATAPERDKAFYANVEKLFKTMYPNANLVLTGMDAGQEGLDVLQMQFASGTAPDVFMYQNRVVPWAQAGYLYDLSDQPWAADVVEAAYPEVRYNGRIYGAPTKVAGWGIYYNKQIYEDGLGLRVPQNFQQFLDNCEAIKRAGYAPLVVGGADSWPYIGLFLSFSSFLYGGNRNIPVDLYNGRTTLAGREVNDLFGAIKTLYDRGYFSDASMSLTYDGAQRQVGEGRAVMMSGAHVELGDLGYNVDVGFFNIPDNNGYNCLPVVADAMFGVNARYRYASTYGADLIKCLVDESSMHIMNDNVGPAAYRNMVMASNTLATRMYQEAFNRGPVVMQTSLWVPVSVYNTGAVPIITSILSGNGFTQQMLTDLQRNYEADKSQVNFTAFR